MIEEIDNGVCVRMVWFLQFLMDYIGLYRQRQLDMAGCLQKACTQAIVCAGI